MKQKSLILVSVLSFSAQTQAAPPPICDPTPIAEVLEFEHGASALDGAQRSKLAAAFNRAFEFEVLAVSLEPKADETEGSPSIRKKLAEARAEYTKAIVTAYGITPKLIGTQSAFALTPVVPTKNHPANRSIAVHIFVLDNIWMDTCLKSR